MSVDPGGDEIEEGLLEARGDEIEEGLPEARGDEIEIVQTVTYQDEFGYRHLHGLLTNTADYSVGGFALEVLVGGEQVAEADSDGAYSIAPGAVFPFNARLPQTVTDLDDLEVNVINIQRGLQDPVEMEIIQSKMKSADGGIVTLVGIVQNNGSSAGLIYSARAAVYASDGELITTAQCQVCPGYLLPGEEAPVQFLIYGHPPSAAIAKNEIFIAAEEAVTVAGLAIDFNEPVHSYTDPAGRFHLLGDLQNNSDIVYSLALTGTFYDQNGEIVGAAAYKLPAYSLPGETSPYEFVVSDPLDSIADWFLRIELARTGEFRTPVFLLVHNAGDLIKNQYQWTVAGNTVNDTGQTLRMVTVVVGIRESGTGKLVGLAHYIAAGELPPGEALNYTVDIYPDPAFDPANLEEFVLLLGE
ncbi:MAG: hypothetical protein U5K99_08895 [Anaerolineales bacterium]|nr:hypothetical protein [Anaerolineales bacterium]